MLEDKVFRALLESAPDGIVLVDSSGRIVLVNAQAERMFGYRQAELMGRPVEVIVPARLRSVHNMHRSAFLNDPRPRPMGAGLTLAARRKDGSEFPVEISLSPIESGSGRIVAAIVRDITERRRAEETLRSQAELLELAHDAIIVLDMSRRIMYWNSGAERTYGWTAVEVLGQTVDSVLHTDPARVDEMVRQLATASIWEGELHHTAQDGRAIIVASRQTLRRGADGTPHSVLEINRDITERKRLEAEHAALALNLERQSERERIAMDLHDGAIQAIYAVTLNLEGVAEALAHDPPVRDSVERSIESLQDVIRDIRGYIFQLRRPDLAGDIVSAIKALGADAERAGLMTVEVNASGAIESLPEPIAVGVYHMVQEALMNAVRHSGADAVTVDLQQNHGWLTVTVADNGRGFDASAVSGESHNGLRNITARAAMLGGEAAVKSTPGAGTTVTLTLPA